MKRCKGHFQLNLSLSMWYTKNEVVRFLTSAVFRDLAPVLVQYDFQKINFRIMTEQIQFKENPEITAKQLSSLFQSAGMNRPIDDLPRLSMMIRNASLTIAAFVDEKLIGIARSMTDFSYCCYLSDLAVSSDYQGRGIGKELVRRTIDRIGPQCNLLLLSAPGAMTYYPSQGFEQVNNGWIIKRTK